MAHAKILIVEDERIVAKDIERSLKSLGYIVVAAVATGQEAIQATLELQPDLVLMDIMLHGSMDGIDAAEQIRTHSQVPVIFLTAYADENTLQRAKITEPFGYIVKPFDERDLHTSIEIALRRRLAEAAIRVALDKEQQLSELKARFWAMAAHQFRNPMSVISSAAQLLERYNHELPEERRREVLFRLRNSIESMNQLLEDVLNVGRAESSKLAFDPVSLDLVEFCRSLIEEIQFTAGNQHSIQLINHDRCAGACLDPKLLRHILSNLLSNAIKYSPEGGTIVFELACPTQKAVFQIKDNGIGIPPADRQHLFEAFHRAENVGKIPGTGLGLTMVKRCLDLHGGEIDVQSEVGIGTTITIRLPLSPSITGNGSSRISTR